MPVKRVLYELVVNDVFWTNVAGPERDLVDVSDAELLRLHRARAGLQEKWRVQVLTPPAPCEGCPGTSENRKIAWAGEFSEMAMLETRDVLRVIDGVQERIRGLKGTWCKLLEELHGLYPRSDSESSSSESGLDIVSLREPNRPTAEETMPGTITRKRVSVYKFTLMIVFPSFRDENDMLRGEEGHTLQFGSVRRLSLVLILKTPSASASRGVPGPPLSQSTATMGERHTWELRSRAVPRKTCSSLQAPPSPTQHNIVRNVEPRLQSGTHCLVFDKSHPAAVRSVSSTQRPTLNNAPAAMQTASQPPLVSTIYSRAAIAACTILSSGAGTSQPTVVARSVRQTMSTAQCPSDTIPVAPPSAEFWYRDGNLIIKVESTYFKLTRSRLERHCGYFARLFNDDETPQAAQQRAEGCPVYTLAGLSLRDFSAFIRYLELPGESILSASNNVVVSLLAASHFLSCKLIFDLAERHLVGSWCSVLSPTAADSPPASYHAAVDILSLAHCFKLTTPVKRVLYELVANDAFWTDVAGPDHDLVDVSDAELLRLHHARAGLQEKWRVQVLTPPAPCEGCPGTSENRKIAWAGEFSEMAMLETRDILRAIDGVQERIRGLKGMWCEVCVDSQVSLWDKVRGERWTQLDSILML
ncbi:hypothetical protein C8Q80DRAFT_1117803 [Daedaleopsis nitida]|nr:hypothetical protein C8Q80DRAFT_1117803 [Daedaleopsis nitida]